MEMTEAIRDAFGAALVLTGSIDGAERTLMDAIAANGSDGSRDALLVETARAALTHQTLSDKWCPLLRSELQALFLLSPTCRYCFVLFMLMRFDVETCSEILNLPTDEVKGAVEQSLLDLPEARRVMYPTENN